MLPLRDFSFIPRLARFQFLRISRLFLFPLFLPGMVAAQSAIVINTMADNRTAGDRLCTLREALDNVNEAADTTAGDCAPGSGLGDEVTLPAGGPAVRTLKMNPALGELFIARDVRIAGPGNGRLKLDGRNRIRILHISGASVTVSHLTFVRGARVPIGAGILLTDAATLEAEDCDFVSNVVATGRVSDPGYDGIIAGAALASEDGTIRLQNCTFLRNGAKMLRGAEVEVEGGAIVLWGGSLTMERCRLERNSTLAFNSYASGGALAARDAAVDISDSTFFRNRADSQDFGFCSGGAVTLVDSTLEVRRSLFADNLARGGEKVIGGAISISGGEMLATNSTFTRNEARAGRVVGEGEVLQGIASGGGIDSFADTTLVNLTLTDNRVNSRALPGRPDQSGFGSQVFHDFGNLTLINTLLAGSPRSRNCEGLAAIAGSRHNLSSDATCILPDSQSAGGVPLSSLVASRLRPDGGPTLSLPLCQRSGFPPGCRSASAAIDAGDDSVLEPPFSLTTDQRGQPRQAGTSVDIGASELQ